jgi:hypothetical protein
MKKLFLFLLLGVFLISFSSATVNEFNSFKFGTLDASTNLVKTNSPVSGVNVRSFICSDSSCSGTLGDLWNGGFFVSGSGINFFYPATLKSSNGYGFWFYKDGYVPYWVKGVTWHGTGSVPDVDRYLSKKENCISEVLIRSFYEKDGNVVVVVQADSPIINKYSPMHLPSEVAPHVKTLVDINAEILDKYGNVVWTGHQPKNIDFSGNAATSFFAYGLSPGDYVFRAYTSSGNEAKCLTYTKDFAQKNFNIYDKDKDDDGHNEDVDCNDYDKNVWQNLQGYRDADGDGYGISPKLTICSGNNLPYGYVDNDLDCDDSNHNVKPGAVEVCEDGVDNDCDGFDDDCDDDEDELDIVDISCFDEVIEGHNQNCNVYVKDSSGVKIGNADVEVFYSDGSSFGSCLTNGITGACGVKDLQNDVGSFEVYAIVSKDGFISDDDKNPKFIYEVLEEKYTIVDLSVYNDAGFSNEDYDFFRGEDLFVKFSVKDSNGIVNDGNLVSRVSLVSSLVGGRIDLEKIEMKNGIYYYKLIPIPKTHDFFGDSNVFAFVFDFEDLSGGQEEVSLMIRNNFPMISSIPGKSVFVGESFNLDLGNFESDVEDSGEDLRWEVVSVGSQVEFSLNGKNLFVNGISEGNCDVVLKLFDLDGDFYEKSFGVEVKKKSPGSSSSGGSGSSCRADWQCSDWGSCIDGYESRFCNDLKECRSLQERPVEFRECSSSERIESFDGVLSFENFSAGDEKGNGFSFWWIVVGALILLILLILFLIFFVI